MMNYEALFNAHVGLQVDKWRHYFPIYDRHLGHLRGTGPRVLEIGVDHGGSMQLWQRFFGWQAQITGLDINPACENLADTLGRANTRIVIGDQSDPKRLEELGEFDVVIDDGSHNRNDQSVSFAHLWPKTKCVYLIEDCHSGYPYIEPVPAITTRYPWVMVMERPKRIIRGTPARDLREDELQARRLFGVKCQS